jgi:hypothetical protein
MKRRERKRRWLRRLVGGSVLLRDVTPTRRELQHAVKHDWRTQTKGWRLGLTERLRDVWRRRWLRLRR